MSNRFLFQPVKPFHVNQSFGANRACVSTDGTRNVITCDGNNPPEGYKSLYGEQGHLGTDLKAYHGQEVYACYEGTVYKIDTNPKSGLDVRIESEYDGILYRHIYEHLMGYQVQVGDKVKTGQLIGWANNSGWSSGDHLHLQIEQKIGSRWVPVDAETYMQKDFALSIRLHTDLFGYLRELLAKLLDNSASKLR